jgi:hypothetical protein
MNRSSAFWLRALRRRALRRHAEDFGRAVEWSGEVERKSAIKFFNAAYRAEESGLRQAYELAADVASRDRELAEVLRLYGNEEGWHRELLVRFLERIGGAVQPMGKVTRLFYRLHGRAERLETIVLMNLMFETIGAVTYRLALRNVKHEAVRSMLTILARDEAFHVPLNLHFLRIQMRAQGNASLRLKLTFHGLLLGLLALPVFSRPKVYAFDGIPTLTLMRAYARALALLFKNAPELGLSVPSWLLALLQVTAAPRGSPAARPVMF